MTDRIRTLAEVEAATRLRAHPEERLASDQMQAIMEAPMAPCGHLVGFLPEGHPDDPEVCIAARQAHVDALMSQLLREHGRAR